MCAEGIMSDTELDSKVINHIICRAKQRQSAILVVEYLRDRFAAPHSRYSREQLAYREHRKFGESDIDHFDILVNDAEWRLERENDLIEASRAFLAGMGDGQIWA